jgi:hypothetical protein
MLIPARRPADLDRQELAMTQRPALALERDPQAVEDFVAGLQAAIERDDLLYVEAACAEPRRGDSARRGAF